MNVRASAWLSECDSIGFQSTATIEQQTLRLTDALLISALFLQRFGIPFGAKPLNIVGPVGGLIALIGLMSGVLAIDRRRLRVFLLLSGWIAFGMVWQVTTPNRFGTGVNYNSLSQFLVLTSFAVLSFSHRVSETAFFTRVNYWFSWIAIAGIAQFVAQFFGIRIFEFSGILPASVLYERWYNLVIPVGIGSLLKSNGFFIIEPSTFSQLMAVGLIIEAMMFRRPRYLILFVLALVLSFSGTGWIVLLSFLVAAAFTLGRRGILIAIGTAMLLALTVGLILLVTPPVAAAFSARIQEFWEIGTSAHMRFVTPFWLLAYVVQREPLSLLMGIGSGASEALSVPWFYDVNTPVKVLLEYGVPALVAYLALFLINRRTPVQRALVFPGMVLFLFSGGYQQFPPILFLILLMLCTARLYTASP